MANTVRFKYGDPKNIFPTFADAQACAVGDLLEFPAGVVGRAEDHTWNTDLATTQEEFHDSFLGVAMAARRASNDPADDLEIAVATEGVFQFPCADSSTYVIGDLVGPAKQTGNALESQKVVKVATANLAIGRIERIVNGTTLFVRIESVVMSGGPRAAA